MGLFDKLTGTRRPVDGVVPLPAHEVRAALLALGGPDVPWLVRDGAAEDADLVAEWRILEPAWRSFFLRTQVVELLRIRLRLVPDRREVRAVDRMWQVTWAGDVPRLALSAEAARGRVSTRSRNWTIGRGEDGEGGDSGPAEVFRADGSDLKDPVRDAVLAAGWTWRGVAFGKL
ncbi:hypothetical protein ACFC34_21600 [Streptomyces sp. NPDC056053]|uniref:hypothetical protein n=1 Tax=Streptomyces sp. NPDC056053 TaxID=3345696 RepID=UPI0035DA10A0